MQDQPDAPLQHQQKMKEETSTFDRHCPNVPLIIHTSSTWKHSNPWRIRATASNSTNGQLTPPGTVCSASGRRRGATGAPALRRDGRECGGRCGRRHVRKRHDGNPSRSNCAGRPHTEARLRQHMSTASPHAQTESDATASQHKPAPGKNGI